jgi:hypothetical protein
VTAAVIAFLSYVYTWNTYYDTLPGSPDKAAGRVYVDNFHGFARYETRGEYARLHTLDHLSEVLVFLLVVGGAIHHWRTRRPSRQQLAAPLSPSASPRRDRPSP